MRKLALACTAFGFLGATTVIAAPIPASTNSISLATAGDVVQVKMKKKKMMKKKMMRGQSTDGQTGQPGGQEVKGGTNSPNQGGGR